MQQRIRPRASNWNIANGGLNSITSSAKRLCMTMTHNRQPLFVHALRPRQNVRVVPCLLLIAGPLELAFICCAGAQSVWYRNLFERCDGRMLARCCFQPGHCLDCHGGASVRAAPWIVPDPAKEHGANRARSINPFAGAKPAALAPDMLQHKSALLQLGHANWARSSVSLPGQQNRCHLVRFQLMIQPQSAVLLWWQEFAVLFVSKLLRVPQQDMGYLQVA